MAKDETTAPDENEASDETAAPSESKESDAADIRAKNMMYMQYFEYLYPDIQDPQDKVDKLLQLLKDKVHPERYALTVHNQDVDKQGNRINPHVHLMMSFKNARWLKSIAKKLGDEHQYIKYWKGNANNGYAYLVHRTKSSRDRYQYDPKSVTANFDYVKLVEEDIPQEIATASEGKAESIKDKLDLLYIGAISKTELEAQLSGSELAQYSRQIDIVWNKRLQRMAAAWREDMRETGRQVQTIWIYGWAGTGKTSLAKDYAKKRGQPYFMAGSSRDIFQGYAGQHTLILDELRPLTIPYHDLLRITDPFGMVDEVMAPSRYADKALACDLIIITTPFSPFEFYNILFPKGSKGVQRDSFDQLQRRITLTLRATNQNIYAMKSDGVRNYYVIAGAAAQPNPYSHANRPPATIDPLDLFHAMFQS